MEKKEKLFDKLRLLKADLATAEDLENLRGLLEDCPEESIQWIAAEIDQFTAGNQGVNEDQFNAVLAKIRNQKQVGSVHRIQREKTRGKHFFPRLAGEVRRSWMRYAAAAVFLFAIAITNLLVINKKGQINAIAKLDVKAPQTNKARITLANGKTIYLDQVDNGKTIEADGVQLTKLADGRIVYSGDANTLVYNTASNPRGSKVIDLELNDHSHVWLNAGSSITYPVVFNGQMRKVSITGEAYFEVSHDPDKPFIVSNGSTSVQVLGTHFNVKAFDNEAELKVTLLEGRVNVTAAGKEQLLAPGQQAIVSNSRIELAKDLNLDDVTAWKNGSTSFHGADMGTILRELERWYDISTEIDHALPATERSLDAPRNIPLQDVLRSLLDDNNIKYRFDPDTRKLTIL